MKWTTTKHISYKIYNLFSLNESLTLPRVSYLDSKRIFLLCLKSKLYQNLWVIIEFLCTRGLLYFIKKSYQMEKSVTSCLEEMLYVE